MSKQFEKVIASYGYWSEGIFMTKEAARKFAEQMIGAAVDGSPLVPGKQFRIISTFLEDQQGANGSQGQVIAVCQEIQRTGPEETK